MSEPRRDPLSDALGRLPAEVAPQRDLWPQIRAEIDATPRARPAMEPGRRLQATWFRLAAGVVLVLATSLTTYLVTRESMQRQIAGASQSLPAPQLNVQPAGFSFGGEQLGAAYLRARADLDESFQQRLASLPPAARAKVERNLAELRRAAAEISATLAEHPSDPLLQDLLMSTYQSELQLLADISELPTAGSLRTDL